MATNQLRCVSVVCAYLKSMSALILHTHITHTQTDIEESPDEIRGVACTFTQFCHIDLPPIVFVFSRNLPRVQKSQISSLWRGKCREKSEKSSF